MSSELKIKQSFNADLLEQYLKKELGNLGRWMAEKKVISAVAHHFSQLDQWPPSRQALNLQVSLGFRNWEQENKELAGQLKPSEVDLKIEVLTIALLKLPKER